MISLIASEFGDTLKAHHLRHLRVGMHIVENVTTLHQRVEQTAMREATSHIKIFLFASDGIGICQNLVHASVLRIECTFHLGIRETCGQVDGPVAEAEEECLCLFVTTIHPGIAQTCIHLMEIIERYPCPRIGSEVTLFESRPDTIAARHAAHIALTPLWVVLRIGIGTGLQFIDPVVESLLALLAACGGIDSQGRQVVSTHVTIQSVPIGIRLPLRCQSGLLEIRCQQPIVVVLHQHTDIQVASLLQRSVK